MDANNAIDVTGHVVLGSTAGEPPVTSTAAERWGAAYAAQRGLPAVLMGIFGVDVASAYTDALFVPEIIEGTRTAKQTELARLSDELRAEQPSLDLTIVATPGHAGSAMVQASARAALVVVGTRGLDGWSGLLLGSTSQYVVTHARGPVAVIGPDLSDDVTEDDPIVLGVDGESDHAATRFAFAEASRERRPLIAVHSWVHSDRWRHDDGSEPTPEYLDEVLRDTIAPVADEYDDVEVRRQVVHGVSDLALLGASTRAAMLVVGTRGRGEFRSVLFGSTSLRLLGRATCPAIVVPEDSGASD